MVSKGIHVVSSISIQEWRVHYTVPKHSRDYSALRTFEMDGMEVDSGNIDGLPNFTGPFTFTVFDDQGNTMSSKTNNLNSYTGNLESGDMTDISGMQSGHRQVHSHCQCL